MRWFALVTALAGCTSTTPLDLNVLPRPPPDGWGQLRVMHASANTGPLDIYVSDLTDPFCSNLSYGFAQGFSEMAAMAYTIQLRPAGESADSAPIYSQDTTLPSTVRKTLVLTGEDAAIQFTELTDELQRVDPGSLQVVNASIANATADFGSDGIVEVTDLVPNATTGATTPDLQATTVTVNGTVYGLPPRPDQGDVVLVVADTQVMLLTYSFTVDVLQAQ